MRPTKQQHRPGCCPTRQTMGSPARDVSKQHQHGRSARLGALAALLASASLSGCGAEAPAPVIAEPVAPITPTVAAPESLPDVTFVDITEEAGIDFVHRNFAQGEKLLPETMGSGVAFLDYDGDGDQDLLFVNSAPWPGQDAERVRQPSPTQALYRNDGTGHFEDVTESAGLNLTLTAWAWPSATTTTTATPTST